MVKKLLPITAIRPNVKGARIKKLLADRGVYRRLYAYAQVSQALKGRKQSGNLHFLWLSVLEATQDSGYSTAEMEAALASQRCPSDLFSSHTRQDYSRLAGVSLSIGLFARIQQLL